jgi:nicotinamidase-related amidase
VVATKVAFALDGGDVIETRTAESPSTDEPTPDYGAYRPELGLTTRDIQIVKHSWNAFYGTELDLELRRRKITGIVLPASRPASAWSPPPGR